MSATHHSEMEGAAPPGPLNRTGLRRARFYETPIPTAAERRCAADFLVILQPGSHRPGASDGNRHSYAYPNASHWPIQHHSWRTVV